jgi:predicted ATPase
VHSEHVENRPKGITRIDLEGLFRQYDHHIPLRAEDRVTILHGRNGVGKTVTLTFVAALLRGNYSVLTRYPFRRLRIEFRDGSFLEARQAVRELDDEARSRSKARGKSARIRSAENGKPVVSLSYSIAGGESGNFEIPSDAVAVSADLARQMPWLARVGDDQWLDQRTDEVLSTEAIMQRYKEVAMPGARMRAGEPPAVHALRLGVPVHFIEAQRLFKMNPTSSSYYREREAPFTSAVGDVAREIAKKIKETDSTYRSTSTRLDDTLPSRLFASSPAAQMLPDEELNRRTRALEEERRRLREIGLVVADTSASFDPNALDETRRAMFAVYLEDNEEKFEVFKQLADRAEILLSILNHKFSPKHIKLDKDEGYKLFSHDERPLDLDRLSSGEQHELVLLHNLLFRVEPGSLLLIDEPELSLHVTWQDEFLEDLIRIAKTVGFDALIATHSPYIVGERRDLMELLGDPV